MFNHQKMRNAAFTLRDKKNPTRVELALIDVKTAFGQLQRDRHRADYDLGWNPVETDVAEAIALAADTFVKWRSIRSDAWHASICFRCSERRQKSCDSAQSHELGFDSRAPLNATLNALQLHRHSPGL